MVFAAPIDLLPGLQQNPEQVFRELNRLCRAPLRNLLKRLQGQASEHEIERLTKYAVHWLAMYLHTRDPASIALFRGHDAWEQFRCYLIWCAGRLLLWELDSPRPRTSELPPREILCDDFEMRVFARPRHKVSGDLLARTCEQGTLWVLVADAAGKSWPAYLIVQGVAQLWAACEKCRDRTPEELLDALDGVLRGCLPEGVFVEATVGRFRQGGEAVLVAGGGSVLLIHDPQQWQVRLRRLSGPLLGVEYPCSLQRDREHWLMPRGSEILLASDGLYDQTIGETRLGKVIVEEVTPRVHGCSLHDAVVSLVERALQHEPQLDDISIITVRNP